MTCLSACGECLWQDADANADWLVTEAGHAARGNGSRTSALFSLHGVLPWASAHNRLPARSHLLVNSLRHRGDDKYAFFSLSAANSLPI